MTPFYTRNGDEGFTGLLGAARVPKYHPRMHALGDVDEATAALGLARSTCRVEDHAAMLLAIQRDLYGLMAELAATPENASQFRQISAEKVTWLEEKTGEVSAGLVIPREFIVPGDSTAGATLALARTIVRRAERQVTELLHTGEVENPELLRYLNRLSSLCFVLELAENSAQGVTTPSLAKDNLPE